MTGTSAILAAAIILDAIFGDPDWLWRRSGHPVTWIGSLIDSLDRTWNRDSDSPDRRRFAGIVALLFLVMIATAAGLVLQRVLGRLPGGWIGTAIVAAVFLAGRSLFDHVQAVATALDQGLGPARHAVAKIVGRDPETLDEAGIAGAAIESAAESFSDGFVAPALWFLLLGLPGIIIYKTVNTADSMIGHLDDRHRAFGWAAAKLDDVLNWPAARLSALLIALAAPAASGTSLRSFRTVGSDARHHASPNAGWPEAAMAGALNIRLGGPRSYAGEVVDHGAINADGKQAKPGDVRGSVRVLVVAAVLLFILAAAAIPY